MLLLNDEILSNTNRVPPVILKINDRKGPQGTARDHQKYARDRRGPQRTTR